MNEIEILKLCDKVVFRSPSEDEIDTLWVQFLKDSRWYDYFVILLLLKHHYRR